MAVSPYVEWDEGHFLLRIYFLNQICSERFEFFVFQ